MVRPLRQADSNYLARPLNAILGVPSHIAVLRALRDAPAGSTGRDVARAAGIFPQAAHDALSRLERAGLVRRHAAGRAYLFSLNRKHRLVREALLPLLDVEAEFGRALRTSLRQAFERRVVAGAVFGSAARGEDAPTSDLDVCLIVEKASQVERVQDHAASVAERVQEEFGVRLAPLAFDRRAFAARHARREALVVNIVKDGRSFIGPEPRDLVRG